MRNKITFSSRAKASLLRAERSDSHERKLDQLGIARAQLQIAERLESNTIGDKIYVNQLWREYEAMGGVR